MKQDNAEKRFSLTILTPTYNRAHTLTACWKSLVRQTNPDFQWLIVDDGSTDGTKKCIETFVAESPDMRIDYVYKENGGKHTALNESHPYIQGNIVLILDSDDTLTPDAVQEVLSAWERYGQDSRVKTIFFYKCNTNGIPLAYVRHPNQVIRTYREKRLSSLHSRDCCDTYRTDAFCAATFPVFKEERFIGESAAHLGIELSGLGVYVDRPIYVCEYLDDGLTKAGRKMRLSNPMGGRYNSEKCMDRRLPLLMRVKNSLLYVCYSLFAGLDGKAMLKETNHKGMVIFGMLPGHLLYLYWKKKFF